MNNKRDNARTNKSDVTRRQALSLAAGAALAGVSPMALPGLAEALARPRQKRPNIVFILGDNHRFDTMGCAGHPFIKTPGMDRLAREGVRFRNAFSTQSLCSPSRASILTGVYSHKHGVVNNHTGWDGRAPIFLEHLHRGGYATAFVGKWHMPGAGLPSLPFLDLFVSYTYREGQGSYFDCPLVVNGKETPSRKSNISEEVTDRALDFMKERHSSGDGRPFCLYLAHRPAHPPFQSLKKIAGMYKDADVKAVLPKTADPWWFGKTNQNVFQGIMMGSYYDQYRKYCETITTMDREIERVLDFIDKSGLRDDTVVIYMGDNGMSWGEHGHHGIREPYEEVVRLPWVMRAPGLIPDPGSVREQMALELDIAPTLLDLAGLPAPKDMDGRSLVPALRSVKAPGRKAFMIQFKRYYPENTPSYTAVRTERYKYVEFQKGRSPWLFDLKDDPREERNLHGTPEGEKRAAELKALLAKME